MKRQLILTVTLASLLSVSAPAAIIISEVSGSTTGSDSEYIELFNTGGSSVDLSGWSIELWDSDNGSQFGLADAGSPYTITTGSIASGGTYLFANSLAEVAYGVTADFLLPSNAIENSSYTMVLVDGSDTVVDSFFVTDGGAGDAPNRAGSPITPTATVGPDGPFLPAGFVRTDAAGSFILLEFSPVPAPSATPGVPNFVIPEPSSSAFLGVLGCLALLRRRR